MIKNCLDPKFVHSFEVDYYFEQVQKVRFMLYDIDNASSSLCDDDFLGSFECTLGEVTISKKIDFCYLNFRKN